MYECPHCGEPRITLFQKLTVKPRQPTTCKACGGRVGVPGWSWGVMVAIAAVMVLGPSLIGPIWGWFVLWGVCLAAYIPIWLWWVPLVKR